MRHLLSWKEEGQVMSFNQLLQNNKSLNLSFLKENLQRNKEIFKVAQTLKEQLLNEQELMHPEEREKTLKNNIVPASEFNQVNVEQLNNLRSYMEMLHEKNINHELELIKNLKERMNHIESKKIEVSSKISGLLQKLNHLSGFTEGFKFVFKEDFYNLVNISKDLITKSGLEVNVEANVATLPVKSKVKNEVSSIVISNESKGIPGNYMTGQNKMIYSLIDGNPNTYFEFFKMNTGPARLVVNMRFAKTEIVNQIKIKRAFTTGSASFVIKDVIFNTNKNRSIKRLIDINEQKMEVSATKNGGELTINHLPMACNSVSVYIESNEYTTTKDGMKIFSLGLQQVELNKIEYDVEGEFNSTTIITPENLFVFSSESKVFPADSVTYTEELSLSKDGGAKRELLVYDSNKTKNLLLSSGQNFINYIYSLKRNDELISSGESISTDDYFVKSRNLLKTVNRNISPINYSLGNNRINKTLKVMQGEVFKRSASREDALYVGRVSLAGENKLVLPFSLKSYGIDEADIRIYGNNYELEQAETYNEIQGNERKYFLNYEENSISMHLGSNKNIKLKMLLAPYKGKILFKNEGYYIKINEPFEYDKGLITVRTKAAKGEEFEQIIPKGSRKHFLPHQNISEDHFKVEVENENKTAWVEATDQIDLKSSSAGILSIKGEGQYRVRYKYNKIKSLTSREFEIWGQGSEIKGVYLYPEAVSFNDGAKEVSGFLSDGETLMLEHSNIIEGTIKFESPLYEGPCKEIEYIDGYSEFLNVKKMKKDFVPRIEWSTENFILFTVSKLPYEGRSYGNSMKLYKDGVEVQGGDSRIEGDGIVYKLERGNDESRYAENYYLEYYYLDETPEPIERYSIDYENGIIHFTKKPDNAPMVYYKYGDIEIEYNLYHEIKNYIVDEQSDTVSVKTEEFGEGNNKIKFFWHEIENQTSLEGLEKYYSPIVYSLKMGMN